MQLQYLDSLKTSIMLFRLMELSIGSDMSSVTFSVEELVSWIANNPEVVKEGLCQINGVRYMIISKSQ